VKYKNSIIEIFSILALIYVNALGVVGNIVCGAILLIWGFAKIEHIYKAFFLTSILSILHPDVLSGGVPILFRYLITFAFIGRLTMYKLRTGEFSLQPNTIRFIIFIGINLLFSMAGLFPVVSTLKLFLLFFVVFLFFESVSYAGEKVNEFMHHTFLAIIIGSWFIFNRYVYVKEWDVYQSGSSGIFSHPQTFGIILAVILTYFIVKFINEKKYFYGLMIVTSMGLIVLSEARTALLSAIISVVIAFFLYGTEMLRKVRRIFRMKGIQFASALIIVLIISFSSVITKSVSDFFKKNRKVETASIIENYNNSRGGLIEKSLIAFAQSPFIGSGFGLTFPVEERRLVRSEYLWNLPISYSVEPGNLYIAFFAEAGVLGGFALLILLGYIFNSIYLKKDIVLTSIFISILLVNLAEACLLAPNGAGGIFLGIIAWAQVKQREKNKINRHRVIY